jgi:hypothetical protein
MIVPTISWPLNAVKPAAKVPAAARLSPNTLILFGVGEK